MSLTVFNACLLLGWMLFTGGLMLINIGAGLAAGGIAMTLLTVLLARTFGLTRPKARKPESEAR